MSVLKIFYRKKRTSRFSPKKRINFQTGESVRSWNINKVFSNKWQKLKQIRSNVNFNLIEINLGTNKLEKRWLQNRYGEQLRNKQALKSFYGPIRDRTFKKYLIKSLKTKNQDPIEKFIQFLECRLEVILYRRGVFKSIFQRRQAIIHSNIQICKRKELKFKTITFPSILLQPGDLIKIKNKNFPVTTDNRNTFFTVLPEENVILLTKLPTLDSIAFPFKVDLKKILGWGRRY